MRIFIIILGLFLAATATADDFMLRSSGFSAGERVPILYTCDGGNISPELYWKNAPSQTQSFALTSEDINSPVISSGKWYGWVLYNIPVDTKELVQGVIDSQLPEGTVIGKNNYDETDYRGPCPPDHRLHHYVFTLYALNVSSLDLSFDPAFDDVLAAIKAHTIKQAELTVIYSH